MTLGEKIQQLRKASGLSQQQLAEQVNVSRQSISKWELNDSIPDVSKLIMISELFSVTIDELLKDEMTSKSSKHRNNPTNTLTEVVKLNHANKQITIGTVTVIMSLILFILEYMFLPVFGRMQKAQVSGHGFYSDFIKYAKVQPMPTIFTITGVIMAIGIILVATGYLNKKGNLKLNFPIFRKMKK